MWLKSSTAIAAFPPLWKVLLSFIFGYSLNGQHIFSLSIPEGPASTDNNYSYRTKQSVFIQYHGDHSNAECVNNSCKDGKIDDRKHLH